MLLINRAVSGARDAPCEWLLKDCVAVHQLLETNFKDNEAASSKPTETHSISIVNAKCSDSGKFWMGLV